MWTKRNSSEINLTAVAWSGRQFLAVGCCSVLTSPDGQKWTRVARELGYGEPVTAGSMPYQWQFESVVWGGSQFVAVGRVVGQAVPLRWDRALIATSPDGAMWTERRASTEAKVLRDVVWSGHRFVAVGDAIFTSSDGVTWSAQRPPGGGELSAVTWADSEFVAVGWKSGVVTSRDGITWTERGARGASLRNIAWSGHQFVALELTMIFTSPDAVTWSPRKQPTGGFLNAVTWGDSQFVVVGAAGIIVSPDGITWTLQPAPRGMYADVVWSGTRFVAVGEVRKGWFADYTVGLIVTSP